METLRWIDRLCSLLLLSLFSLFFISPIALAQSTASSLPLLSTANIASVTVYGTFTDNITQSRVNDAFGEANSYGVNSDFLTLGWDQFEPSFQNYTTDILTTIIPIIQALNLIPYYNIKTIDTNNLAIPSDLKDPNNSAELRAGLSWNSTEMKNRFTQMLQVVIPVYLQVSTTFFIGVGNEVDVWLGSHSNQVDAYIDFMLYASNQIKSISSKMGLASGVSLTLTGCIASPSLATKLFNASDVAVLTYYPLGDDFIVEDPSIALTQTSLVFDTIIPSTMQIIFQEIGYPSGYINKTSFDNSSQAKQRDFIKIMIDEVLGKNKQRIRGWCIFLLNDYSDSLCETFTQYYGINATAFKEYLCSLGMLMENGLPKLAWEGYLESLQNYFSPNSTSSASPGILSSTPTASRNPSNSSGGSSDGDGVDGGSADELVGVVLYLIKIIV